MLVGTSNLMGGEETRGDDVVRCSSSGRTDGEVATAVGSQDWMVDGEGRVAAWFCRGWCGFLSPSEWIETHQMFEKRVTSLCIDGD